MALFHTSIVAYSTYMDYLVCTIVVYSVLLNSYSVILIAGQAIGGLIQPECFGAGVTATAECRAQLL